MNFKTSLALGLLVVSMTSVADDRATTNTLVQAADGGLNHAGLNHNTQQKRLRAQARQIIQQFATTLKRELVTAIQSGGLVHAVDVCAIAAPEIAADLSTNGWQVARTSLKTRNDQNQPDSWEIDMLERFDSQFKAGAKANALNVSLYEQQQFRYMQAIPTDQVCLACHGASIEAALSEAIKQQYPNDRATGFTLNDIRGAFTLSKALDD